MTSQGTITYKQGIFTSNGGDIYNTERDYGGEILGERYRSIKTI